MGNVLAFVSSRYNNGNTDIRRFFRYWVFTEMPQNNGSKNKGEVEEKNNVDNR
jgi:hypothetical protein